MQEILKGETYGTATVGERGQLVIPAALRKALNINPGDQLMVFAKLDKKVVSLMSLKDFNQFLKRATRVISQLENKYAKKE